MPPFSNLDLRFKIYRIFLHYAFYTSLYSQYPRAWEKRPWRPETALLFATGTPTNATATANVKIAPSAGDTSVSVTLVTWVTHTVVAQVSISLTSFSNDASFYWLRTASATGKKKKEVTAKCKVRKWIIFLMQLHFNAYMYVLVTCLSTNHFIHL